MITHTLLRRQLKKANISSIEDIDEKTFDKLLHLVQQSYDEYEEDKELYENTLQLSSLEFQELNQSLSEKVKELEKINTNIKASIEYASLMQQAILPDLQILEEFFQDYFICWNPKDIVGGDIYLVNKPDNESILIMIIDGAGHGVSGAFLTMLVKAIEEQIMAKIKEKKLAPSPALILEHFNHSIKMMLHQDTQSISNSGFDGGILYYNKKTNVCKYAGAKTPLYILDDGQLNVIKSDRKSVGFIRTDEKQKYTEYEINIQKDTRLYITTDGIPDQEGENNSRYGIEQFKTLILKHHKEKFSEQYSALQESFLSFKGTSKQSDDITAIGLLF